MYAWVYLGIRTVIVRHCIFVGNGMVNGIWSTTHPQQHCCLSSIDWSILFRRPPRFAPLSCGLGGWSWCLPDLSYGHGKFVRRARHETTAAECGAFGCGNTYEAGKPNPRERPANALRNKPHRTLPFGCCGALFWYCTQLYPAIRGSTSWRSR